MMIPGADGRTYSCQYCDAQALVAVDAAQLAQGMALDLADVDALLVRLADTLGASLPERTKVQRHGARVSSIEITFTSDIFVAKRDGQGVIAQQRKLVRGIALKTTTHALDRWVEQLLRALAALANENARASQALSGLTRR